MPCYVFRCSKHGEFEKIVPVGTTLHWQCPKCKKKSPQVPARPAPMVWGRNGASKWN